MKKTLVFPRWISGIFLASFLGTFSACGGGGDGGDLDKVTPSATSSTPASNANSSQPTIPAQTTPTGAGTGSGAPGATAASGSTGNDTSATPTGGSATSSNTEASTATGVSGGTSNSSQQASTGTGTGGSASSGTTSGTTGGNTPAGSAQQTTTASGTGSSTSGATVTSGTANGSGSTTPAQTTSTGAGTGSGASGTTAASGSTGNGTSATAGQSTSTGGSTTSSNTGASTAAGASGGTSTTPTQQASTGTGTSGSSSSGTTATSGTTGGSTSTTTTQPTSGGGTSGTSSSGGSTSTTAGQSTSAAATGTTALILGAPTIPTAARFKVMNSTPSPDATGVSANSAIVLNFAGEMNAGDINSTTFTVDNGVSNVPGTVTYTGQTATFTPSAILGLRTANTVTLASSVRNAAGDSMGAPFIFSFMTGDNLDTSPPTVTSTSPMVGAVGVFVNRFIDLNFSEAVNASDITSATLKVTKDSDGSSVSGVVSYSGITAAFTPDAELETDTSYTVSLDSSVRDLAGNALGSGFQYSFTTGNGRDIARPTVKRKDPAANTRFVSTDTKIVLTFSEVLIASEVTTETFRVKNESDGTYIAGAVVYDRLIGTFTPDSLLDPDTNYTVMLSCSLQDLAQNQLGVKNANGDVIDCSDFTYPFKTAPPEADETAPSILSSAPSGFATGIYVHSPIILNFSEKMDPSDVNTSNIVVNDGSSDISGSVSYSGTRATFTPDTDLKYDTLYTVIVSANVRDVSGLPIGATNRIFFTTALAGYVSHLAKLPDTGQTVSYSAAFGDDSDYNISPPSYTDNGNSTVTDNVTSLVWQQEDDSVLRTWSESSDYCGSLSLAGKTDWRLPTIFELESITNSNVVSPSINSSYFSNTRVDNPYWSYTTSAGHTANAWNVHFTNGTVGFDYKANVYYVRCVRPLN